MKLVALPAEEDAVRRYTEDLWIPFNRELEGVVEEFALAEDVDVVDEEVEFRLDRLDSEGYRGWVAVDGLPEGTGDVDLATVDADLAGFLLTSVDEAPTVFDQPDRLVIGDIYVREQYRGEGLARDLVDRAAERAREAGCEEVVLDVDVGNDRALAFYEKCGFETYRHRMGVDVEDLQ